MTLPLLALVLGLVLVTWSADRFVEGAACAAKHFKMPPLLVGMLIIGFGTSAPEIAVSALAALQGNSTIGLGNAYGSNIANLALILGLTALIKPIAVQSRILRKELPLLAAVTGLAAYQLWDGQLTRLEALSMLSLFLGLFAWTIVEGLKRPGDTLAREMSEELKSRQMSMRQALFWLLAGLVLLIISSRLLIWGAVEIALALQIDELLIGLTLVAVGTSLPELATAISAVRKGEPDLALGNVIGSNLFNTLAVVGIATVIQPTDTPAELLNRDMLVLVFLTLSLFFIGYGFRGRQGSINRYEGALLLLVYAGYTGHLVSSAVCH